MALVTYPHVIQAYGPDGLFVSQRTGSHSAGIHVPFTNCFVCRWFCVVHDPKPPLHSRNWLSFGKFQDTERFLIHCERHFSSRLPPSGGTWKYAKAPSIKKKLGEILYLLICSFLPCLSWLLRSGVRKSRRDLWITLYICVLIFSTTFVWNISSKKNSAIINVHIGLRVKYPSLLSDFNASLFSSTYFRKIFK